MKTPRFEESAGAWKSDATFYIVYTREAHPNARGFDRLSGFADMVAKMDRDGDNAISRAEFEGPDEMFQPFDLDHDLVIRSHELLAARRIDQFAAVDEPKTLEERLAAARRFRAEVPGAIDVLVDPIGEPTARAYGGMPNSAFVIGRDGRIAAAFPWASVLEVDAALARIVGREATAPSRAPDLAPIAAQLRASQQNGKPVLIQFTSPGCGACTRMHDQTLEDPRVKARLDGFERIELGVEQDPHWALFESLDLATTPAFVVVSADGAVGTRVQGFQAPEAFLAVLPDAKRRHTPR
jgi:hypothetical protein